MADPDRIRLMAIEPSLTLSRDLRTQSYRPSRGPYAGHCGKDRVSPTV